MSIWPISWMIEVRGGYCYHFYDVEVETDQAGRLETEGEPAVASGSSERQSPVSLVASQDS